MNHFINCGDGITIQPVAANTFAVHLDGDYEGTRVGIEAATVLVEDIRNFLRATSFRRVA